MAKMNRDMELTAVDEIDPGPSDAVLSVGFGPGVGIAELAARLVEGRVMGIDPSRTMVEQARRRNRAGSATARVDRRGAAAEAIPWPDDSFDGVLAVNSMQMWEPLDLALREVARVLVPGGTFVAVTHVWAIEKLGTAESWSRDAERFLRAAGLDPDTPRTTAFRSGAGMIQRATLPLDRNRIAPSNRPRRA